MQTQRKVNHWRYIEKGKSLSSFRACDCSSRHTANPLRWHFWDSKYNYVSPSGSFTFYSKSFILTMVSSYCQSSNRRLRADLKHSNELPIPRQKNRPYTQIPLGIGIGVSLSVLASANWSSADDQMTRHIPGSVVLLLASVLSKCWDSDCN